MRFGISLLGLGLLVGPAPSGAQDLEPTGLYGSDLEAQTKELISARWQVDGSDLVVEWGAYSRGRPDPYGEVELRGSGSGGNWIVSFELESGGRASVRARAGIVTPQPVASRRLQRGEILSSDNMAVANSVVWGAPKPSGPAPSEGWTVQRVLAPGDPLRIPAVRPPLAVVSGSMVELIWDKGAIGLSLPGTAAGSAVLGDTVFVRTESGRRLRGVAVAPGTVNVTSGGSK